MLIIWRQHKHLWELAVLWEDIEIDDFYEVFSFLYSFDFQHPWRKSLLAKIFRTTWIERRPIVLAISSRSIGDASSFGDRLKSGGGARGVAPTRTSQTRSAPVIVACSGCRSLCGFAERGAQCVKPSRVSRTGPEVFGNFFFKMTPAGGLWSLKFFWRPSKDEIYSKLNCTKFETNSYRYNLGVNKSDCVKRCCGTRDVDKRRCGLLHR